MTSPDKPPTDNRQPQQYLHGDTTGAAWQSHQQHAAPNPASSPVPPGFVVEGERLRETSSGAVSAPPPGFIPEGTSRSEMMMAKKGPEPPKGPSSALSAEMAQVSGGRTSSFVNLAAVLGTGLAESMDDATKGDLSQREQQGGHNIGLHNLSFTRQSRHAAARLIGASPPRGIDTLGLEGSFLGGGGAAPATLGGGNFFNARTQSVGAQQQQQRQQQQQVGGFLPSTFESDTDGLVTDQPQQTTRREYSPLSMFGANANRRGDFPASKDVGVTVMEPGCEHGCVEPFAAERHVSGNGAYNEDSGGVLAALMQEQQGYCNDPQCVQQQQRQHYDQPATSPDRDTFEVEQGMRNLWVDDNQSYGEASRHSKSRQQTQQQYMDGRSVASGRSITSERSASSQSSRHIAEAEIRPFLWDTRLPQHQASQFPRQQGQIEPSRCLAILRAAHLQIPEVRSTCEAFGTLESFRSDFADRGIILLSYYDIRSAQYAGLDLEAVLKRRDSNSHGGPSQDIGVYYCVPLNSSTPTDESRLILSDVPPYVDEHSLLSMLTSYGAVRSLRKHGGYYGGSSFEAEFHNVQDAKQALLELSSTQPWGPDVAIEVGMRPPIDRKRGRELLAVIGRWRHGAKTNGSPASSTARTFEAPSRLGPGANYYRGTESSASSSPALAAPSETTQLVLGPDGRYTYMIVNNQSGYPQPSSSDYNNPYRRNQPQEHVEQQRQQIVHGPNGEIYITTVAVPAHQPPPQHTSNRQGGPRTSREYWPPSTQPPPHQYSSASYHPADGRERLDRISGPYYSQHVVSDHHSGPHHHHHNPHHSHNGNTSTSSVGGDEKDNKHLVLDLENVENGRDIRTSLMVRNIPNKYTQQMLLAEFTENGLGPGVIDFFYLPIDFKNRCNRGYAFINFVEFKDILPFHRRYFGKHWSTFNSDKICDITYARIQGKAAMLKRFENSALMEKDEEYKPLVFISHGPEKGKRVPFPEAAAGVGSGKP